MSTEAKAVDGAGAGARMGAPLQRGPLGLNAEFCQHRESVSYLLKPQSFASSGYDLRVTYMGQEQDKNAYEPFQLESTFSGKCMIYTASGKQLYTLRRKVFSLSPCYELYDETNTKLLATIKGHAAFNANLDITFNNAASGQGERRHLELQTGNYRSLSEVHENGLVIATIEREDFMSRIFTIRDPYKLTVSPNFDVTLALVLNICMHAQLMRRKRGGGGAGGGGTF